MPMLYQMGDDWIFNCGKHEGRSVREVSEDDPTYLEWVHKEVDDLPTEAYKELELYMEEMD